VPGLSPPQSPPQRPLRYDAYEAPSPTRRLASRSPTQDRSRSSTSARSPSQLSVDSLSSDFIDPEMAKTMTAGQLTLLPSEVRNLEYSPFLNLNQEVDHLVSPTPLQQTSCVNGGERLQTGRADLIALGSPFIADPPDQIVHEDSSASSQSLDFESVWNSLENSNSRGWCERSSDDIVRLLQKLQLKLRVTSTDQPPFEGRISFASYQLCDQS